MRHSALKNVSAIALMAALAIVPVTQAHAQNANASDRGQEMGQGTPGETNPNAGPGNNSGQGNSEPGSTGAEMSGNANAGPGNNSGNGNTSPGTSATANGNAGGTTSAGPEDGHNCGGAGHIDNDAPGHQHDDCAADTMGSLNASGPSKAAIGNSAAVPVGVPAAALAAGGAGGSIQFTPMDCSFSEGITPIFGALTEEEAAVLESADEAALVPVLCPEATSDATAQQAIAGNPGLVNALESQGFGVHQVIAADPRGSVPTVYVEVQSAN